MSLLTKSSTLGTNVSKINHEMTYYKREFGTSFCYSAKNL